MDEVIRLSGGLEGKHLLEIGSDPGGEFLHRALTEGRLASAVGVNPVLEHAVEKPGMLLLPEDARSLSLGDGTIDVITSMSVFEHVTNLGEVLAECHRVLKPGGILISEFSPIWSAAWGHHLWFYHGGKVVSWTSHPLPPYAHLLMEPAELRAWCDSAFGDSGLSEKIVAFVYESPEQNRMFYSDYLDVFERSALDVVFAVGFADVPFPSQVPKCDYLATFAQLHRKFPGKSGFGHQGMLAMLSRPAR